MIADAPHPCFVRLARRPANRAGAIVAAALFALLGGGCNQLLVKDGRDAVAQAQRAAEYVRNGNHGRAAEIYERLADSASGARRDEWLLKAAHAWYDARDTGRAGAAVRRLETPPGPGSDPVVTVLSAMLALTEGDADQALATLARLPDPVPDDVAPFAHEIEGRARFRLDDPAGAVAALNEREVWLPDRATVLANHRIIWDGLTALKNRPDLFTTEQGVDAAVSGWLELAALFARAETTGEPFAPLAANWRAEHPAHPASSGLLDDLLGIPLGSVEYPRVVALLLPLTGRLQAPAEAVRDGFIAAYLGKDEPLQRPLVRVYDTHTIGAVEAYRIALEEGAGAVVGPLAKSEVQEVAARALAGVTTVALNYLPDEFVAPPAFYQFGLAPEDEARQAAQTAIERGFSRAVALVPDNAWGARMLQSFGPSFEGLGGTLLQYEVYDAGASDHHGPIRRLLHLDLSEQRKLSLEARLGLDLEFQPRRRRDAEFVFLASQPDAGRLLRPQLKFHYALNLPVFATSAIYEPDERANVDLDGVEFPDMPWIVRPDDDALRLRNDLRSLWPQRFARVQRLYALGYDAYRLIPAVAGSEPPLETPIDGLSGTLTVDRSGRVQRQLDWAHIAEGRLEPGPPVTDENDADAVAAAGARLAP